MTNYVLESEYEVERLELQHQNMLYQFAYEVDEEDLMIPRGGTFLDAGCGSGIVARKVAKVNENITSYALDNSSERIKQAEKLKENKGYRIHFETGDLRKMPYRSNFFDLVVCRFVYEHNPYDINTLTQEIFRVLKPGGRYILIDVDGILYNLETDNKIVNLCLWSLKEKLTFFDGYICKKIPKNLIRCGFNIDRIKKTPLLFFDIKEREHEHAMWVLRFAQAREHFVSVLGDKLFDLFRESYLQEILKKENFLYYNKFTFFCEKLQ